MGYSPVTVGEDFPLNLTCVLDTGGPLPLASVQTIALVFHPAPGSPDTNQRFQTSGAITVTDAAGGTCSYVPDSSDKARLLAGQWRWQMMVTYTSGLTRYGSPLSLEAVDPL